MARSTSTFRDLLLRLPPATVVLLVSTTFGQANGHAVPRQTVTVGYHELNIVAWPPLPTEAPLSPFELLRRQEDNTICGYIGGNSALPATCSAGSHCVLDSDSGFVGCCPNGESSCTTGVFTGCVDYNSGPLTEVNPYIYTCAGSDVCYKNQFAGGFAQYGCGTASDLATTVPLTASGVSSLDLISTSVALTASPISLSEPTSINPSTGTRSFTKISLSIKPPTSTNSATSTRSSSTSASTSSETTSTSSTRSSISSTSATTSSSVTSSAGTSAPSPSSTEAAASGGSSFNRTGAIVGGSIGGIAALLAVIALVFFCRRRNGRRGPGPAPGSAPMTEYMSPMGHGAAFAPLPTWQEEEETAPTPRPQYNRPYTGTTTEIFSGPEVAAPLRYNPVQASESDIGLAGMPAEPMRRSHSGEIDEFSRGYTDAVGRIQEDDRQPLTVIPPDENRYSSEAGSPSRSSNLGNRPLWQQNRQQSRNLMWM